MVRFPIRIRLQFETRKNFQRQAMYSYKTRIAYPSSYGSYILDMIRSSYVDEYESARSSDWDLALHLRQTGMNLESDWVKRAVEDTVNRLLSYPQPSCYVIKKSKRGLIMNNHNIIVF